MMGNIRNAFFSISLVGILFSCGGSGDSTPDPDPDPIVVNLPKKAQGLLPANGEPCSEFQDVSSEPSKAEIFFEWTSAEFADSYELKVFESQNEIFSQTLSATETKVVLDRGKSYSWSIISKNDDGETASDTFSFTAPGEPIGNYVPYAAEITVDFNSNSSEMNVSWQGSDEDGDELMFDVTISEDGAIIEEHVDLTVSTLDPIAVIVNTIYEIQVISKDGAGNFSVSETTAVFED
ncbi:hypothetical protein [Flagellimonas sp. 2504JD4-2]